MTNFRRVSLIASILALLALAPAALAQDMSFSAYLQMVATKARAEGVRQQTIDSMFAGLTPSQRVLDLDQDNLTPSQPNTSTGFPSLANYLRRHNTRDRIEDGREVYARLGPLVGQVERRYGVPANILVAIWGHETAYGEIKGHFDLAQSLATLGWEGRRRALFERELIDLLKIADSGVPRSELVGSWAGAFGNPQFLPSVYLRLAVDADHDGVRDIWDDDADTLYSIANYFHDAGWRAGQPWAVRAWVPNSLDRASIAPKVVSPVCPRVHGRHSQWKTVREWKALGVRPRAPIGDDVMTSLFEPDGPAAPGYLITQNYRVILEYNCSNYYAMSVGLLADAISR